MRIVIPCEDNNGLESMRSGHFGHAPWLCVADLTEGKEIASVQCLPNADHDAMGCAGVIEHVMGLGADAIITAGMGMPPLMRFTNAGITVFADRAVPTAGEVLARFLAGEVARMSPDDACRH